ncbi:FHA domain protein [Bifidobacterium gallicum DSM 20093 = LMG 11596]|uniref:FHA domain protein n=1 Tax=Bifidobacterium gallicum DSM 20093 = LMG 11596 TaxID=561180 RepID=D1NW61_9BIFI|nr:FHA domain protein [Bifidobacterium gallicum DSM 20093 = LMG 11596]KFI60060.1 FHA domain protein [Bifidobacterium gallicum DSM 20093 = LMG 11596]
MTVALLGARPHAADAWCTTHGTNGNRFPAIQELRTPMITELTFAALKYGFLILLWVFVWLVVRSLRRDVETFSPRKSRAHRRKDRAARKAAAGPTRSAQPMPVAPVAGVAAAGAGVAGAGAGVAAAGAAGAGVAANVNAARSASNMATAGAGAVSAQRARASERVEEPVPRTSDFPAARNAAGVAGAAGAAAGAANYASGSAYTGDGSADLANLALSVEQAKANAAMAGVDSAASAANAVNAASAGRHAAAHQGAHAAQPVPDAPATPSSAHSAYSAHSAPVPVPPVSAGAMGAAGAAGGYAADRSAQQAAFRPTLLVIIDGPLAGSSIPLNDAPVTLGRAASNSLVLDDEFVSSHHARVYPDPETGVWAVEDLHSTNGTVVNQQRITTPTILGPRVPVRIGATTFELR